MNNSKTKSIVMSALIAALYAVLTYFAAALSLAFGPIQFRISEVLTILPIFTPAAIPGLTIGCFISNFASFNLLDIAFGTLASLIAALLTRAFRKKLVFGVPLLSMLMPVIINAVIIGLEIAVFYFGGFTFMGFLTAMIEVGISQLVICVGLGIPFYKVLDKMKERVF